MALFTSPFAVTRIWPDPPMIDPYIERINMKVDTPISTAKLAVVILEPKIGIKSTLTIVRKLSNERKVRYIQ